MTRSSASEPVLDPATVRRLLHRDPYWAVYALGDLDPRRAQHCDWYAAGDSVALLYREFGTPILFAAGEPAVLEAIPDIEACHLQIPDAFLSALERRFTVDWSRRVHRMSLRPGDFIPSEGAALVEPLDDSQEDEIRALFADGRASEEEPDFFMRSQLGDGTFFGVRRDGRLVAAGGTHLYSERESVGAVGNVYTHRSYRGRGYASAVTAAIVQRLIERRTETIALNVRSGNRAAIRVYERLGFRLHAHFWEGRATHR